MDEWILFWLCYRLHNFASFGRYSPFSSFFPHLGSIKPHFSPFLPASIFQHVCSNWRFRPWTTNSQTRPAGSPRSVSSCGSLDNLRWAMISPLVKPVGGQRWPGGQGGWGWRLGGMEHQDMMVFMGKIMMNPWIFWTCFPSIFRHLYTGRKLYSWIVFLKTLLPSGKPLFWIRSGNGVSKMINVGPGM